MLGSGRLKGKSDLLVMLVGTLLVGLSGYVFLALIGHGRFDPATTAALSAVYLLGNILGPGAFFALEQETSRVISDALSREVVTGSRVRRLAIVDVILTLAVLLVMAGLTNALLDRVLDDQFGMILALALTIVGSAGVYLIRGLTGGQRRFRRYGVSVLIDGAARIVGCLILVVLGSDDSAAWAFALCAGPAIAAIFTVRGSVPTAGSVISRPPSTWQLGRDVGWLLAASGLWMIMANVAPVVVTAMLVDDPVTAAGFAAAMVLTRVPLLLMGPIQAMLLPQMTAAVASDNRAALRSVVIRGLIVIAGLGLIAVLVTGLIGRQVTALLFGADRDTTGSWPLIWLTVSAVIFMAVLLLQPALVALRLHRMLVLAWVGGAVAFTASFALPLPAVDCGIVAQIVGPLVTLGVQLLVLQHYARTARHARDRAVTVPPELGPQ
jgi:O-antigen/teichoic acid export membrane protein